MKMRYKDFEFPSNPAVIKTELSNNVREDPLFGRDSAVYNVSRNAAVISGEGSLWDTDRITVATELKQLHKRGGAGWLFLPDGSCYNAFFTLLTISEDAKKGCITYAFSFTENCDHTETEYDFGYTYAKENENMFDIAFRCNTQIEKLMGLNDFETPFSVNAGDRVVLK